MNISRPAAMQPPSRPEHIRINEFAYGAYPEAGKRPEERNIEERLAFGYFLLDKDSGPTSFKAASAAARLAGAKKAGHSGTLEPKVTGLLVVAVGRATKLLGYLLAGGKEYRARMHVNDDVPQERLKKAFEHFTGVIEQMPPVRSRVKRQLRKREIYSITDVSRDGREVDFTVACEGGTYVRKLCHDIGEYLGCGAHMTALRRTKVGPFRVDDAKTRAEIEELARDEEALRAFIRPGEGLVARLPRICLADHAVRLAASGIPVKMMGVVSVEPGLEKGADAAVMTRKKELIGVGVVQKAPVGPDEDPGTVLVKLKTTVMDPAAYPHYSEYVPPEGAGDCAAAGARPPT